VQPRQTPILLLVAVLIAAATAVLWAGWKIEDRVFTAVFTPSAVKVGSAAPEETEPPFRYCQSPDGQWTVAYQPDMASLCPPGWVKVVPPTTAIATPIATPASATPPPTLQAAGRSQGGHAP